LAREPTQIDDRNIQWIEFNEPQTKIWSNFMLEEKRLPFHAAWQEFIDKNS